MGVPACYGVVGIIFQIDHNMRHTKQQAHHHLSWHFNTTHTPRQSAKTRDLSEHVMHRSCNVNSMTLVNKLLFIYKCGIYADRLKEK